jgi:hypothetical protein
MKTQDSIRCPYEDCPDKWHPPGTMFCPYLGKPIGPVQGPGKKPWKYISIALILLLLASLGAYQYIQGLKPEPASTGEHNVQTPQPTVNSPMAQPSTAVKPPSEVTSGNHTGEAHVISQRPIPAKLRMNIIPEDADMLMRRDGSDQQPGVVDIPYKKGEMEIDPGRYEITVSREGYELRSEALHAASGQSYNLDITLQKKQDLIPNVSSTPLQPQGGAQAQLTINVKPNDAQVRFVGIKRSYEPGMQLDLGKYQIEVSKPGYQAVRQWLSLLEAKSFDINIKLQETSKAELGSLMVRSFPAGSVSIDGKLLGSTPYKTQLPTGTHQVKVCFQDKCSAEQIKLEKEGKTIEFRDFKRIQ